MPEFTPDNCPHERRPGTTVCLHCRYASRAAARAERRRRIGAVLSVGVAVALVGGAAVYGANAAADGRALATLGESAARLARELPSMRLDVKRLSASVDRAAARPPQAAVRETVTIVSLATDSGVSGNETPAADSSAVDSASSPDSARTDTAVTPPVASVIPEGRTELRDGMFAVRTADTVKVHFDTEMGRTRRSDKFERIVRSTLPEVYGPAVDSVLAAIPQGELAPTGDLVADLSERGVHLALGAGWTLALWPETRPGRQGPIVVTYRAVVAR